MYVQCSCWNYREFIIDTEGIEPTPSDLVAVY